MAKVKFKHSGKWDMRCGGPYIEGKGGEVSEEISDAHAEQLVAWKVATIVKTRKSKAKAADGTDDGAAVVPVNEDRENKGLDPI